MSWWVKIRSLLHLHDPKVRMPVAISLGAIAGALSRYYISLGFAHWLGTAFPFGTFAINLSGAFGMGLFTGLGLNRNWLSPDLRALVAVGFLGSYTTFSTYQLEAERLTGSGQWQMPLYLGGSAILGVLCLELGSYLARKLP